MRREKRQMRVDENKTKILIVEDHPIVQKGLLQLINEESDLFICGQAEDGPEAMGLIKSLEPDLVTVDLFLKKSNGLDLIKDIKQQFPSLPILVLSMHEESLYAERALRAGARGYIMKAEAIKNLIGAIRKVLKGQIYVSEKISAIMIDKLTVGKAKFGASPADCLSDRELEVFLLIGKGYGTSQIAKKLCLSVKTIETYRSHIKEKLNISNAAGLLRYAIPWVNTQKTGLSE
ncbi:response regulator [Planctomycetota bacterium]